MNKTSAIDAAEALSYRTPMRVSAARCFNSPVGVAVFPVCPRCRLTMEREYQSFCDRCGQALDWKGFRLSKAAAQFDR